MVLLPLRGALGAVQACAAAATVPGVASDLVLTATAAMDHPGGADHGGHPGHPDPADHLDHQKHWDHSDHRAHLDQQTPAGQGAHPQGGALPEPGCSDCMAWCCLLPLPVATLPALPALPAAMACFAEPGAPAASFVCDGQERPPRSR